MAKVARPLTLVLLMACHPPGGEPGTATSASSTSIGTDGVSSSSAATTPTTTDASGTTLSGTTSSAPEATVSTSGETTIEPPSPTSWTTDPGDDTTGGFVCNWNIDVPTFCPHATASNASLSGTTPLGPIDFKYAYFGLLAGCVDCPYASDGALVFFSEPDATQDDKAHRLRVINYSGALLSLTLAGGQPENYQADTNSGISVVYMDLHVPGVAETNPPLDPEAPPVLSGKLSITGGGWNVSGEFTATLCRHVDNLVPCS